MIFWKDKWKEVVVLFGKDEGSVGEGGQCVVVVWRMGGWCC